MKILGGLLFWLVCNSVALATEEYTLDASHSQVTFRVRQYFSMVTGRFTGVFGTVTFDSERPERSHVEATIPVKSIDTGILTRDHHLLAADFFDAEKYPTISFKSTSVRLIGARVANVYGDLTMHGETRPEVIRVELLPPEKTSNTLSWRVTAHLRRSDFGLKWNPMIEAASAISDDIEVQMSIVTPAR